jgi:hypothetical protein
MKVAGTEAELAEHISDHLPLVASLRLDEPGQPAA